ncbi:unnamed protein product [Cuscuta epithymum]|uniref:Uncharacterized protein n=1 Tax=Cuscuta epithymum TaxID=186058 RepID=A0AAV0G8X2_9ASTE|nr:unnamed protein product [Cuscuta epithymum]
MVAISLYKGSLHKVATDVPRRWLVPAPKISLKDFRVLLLRRSKALSRLQSTTEAETAAAAAVPATSNPNPSPADTRASKVAVQIVHTQVEQPNNEKGEERLEVGVEVEGYEPTVTKAAHGVEFPNKLAVESDVVLNRKVDGVKAETSERLTNNKEDVPSDKEKRIKEVEQKLVVLNAKKHSLVQLLKQILGAEEVLKGRQSQGIMMGRPPIPLQVDITNDTGSMTRLGTPRVGSDGLSTEAEGEGDDFSNPNMHSRNLLRMNSTSPSPDSQYRKPVHNKVPFSSRTTNMGVIGGTPSSFAPSGQQGLPLIPPPGPPSVCIPGASNITSTPSPSLSGGGTPGFRDAHLPSPWS